MKNTFASRCGRGSNSRPLAWQASILTKLNYRTKSTNKKSGKRDSNSRPRPWQGRALPTELLPRCRGQGQIRTAEAVRQQIYSLPVLTTYLPTQSTDRRPDGDSCGIQTHNLLIRSQMLYSVELRSHNHFLGGRWGIRTPDPLLVRQTLWTSWAKRPIRCHQSTSLGASLANCGAKIRQFLELTKQFHVFFWDYHVFANYFSLLHYIYSHFELHFLSNRT